nr:secretin N-terminal domain-containing protein [Pyrinomonadaceae bacterium]
MNRPAYLRALSLLLLLCLLSPTAALAYGDGKKFFKEGMKHEIAEEWDKAAEAFAKALSENPRNPEYRLHLQRSLFEASQQYMKKGRTAAEQKDYAAAYTYFRKAYAFDPVNELAKSEMARMVRMQEGVLNGEGKEPKAGADVKFTQTGYNPADDPKMPQKFEKLRDIPFPSGVNLTFLIKELAKDLELNVLFDTDSRLDTRQIKIELKNVTAAKALDYIFLQESLFFQKVGPRTILVAGNQRRTNFQQLVLRTFYLANANPKDVKTIIQTAIPPQPGRTQTIVVEDAATNSLTIRDTAENIALFERLIGSLDKDRAEVVMDVAIYEVSKTDLLKLGNQIGTESQLTTLGGTTSGVVGLGGNDLFGSLSRATATAAAIPSVFGAGIVLPAANLVAFQSKGNTKLLASTQIHAFNNEDSSARIGQRVPVRTASFSPVVGSGGNNNVFGDVINYEQVGLTLKFKPIVFPNQDVQVAMDIESKDVVAGGTDNNPIFSERKIVGTARVQNNKTLLLASVAQDVESRGRQGLPLLGLIPILGRLFAAPTRDNRQVDIVIAVTPKVIRAPAILPEDEIERPTGSMALPTNGSLEAMIIQEERGEQLAMARRLPTNTAVQLPDQPSAPGYVRGAQPDPTTTATTTAATEATTAPEKTAENAVAASPGLNLKPIDTSAKTLDIRQTSDTSVATSEPKTVEPKQTLSVDQPGEAKTRSTSASSAELSLPSFFREMKRGDKLTIPVMVKSSSLFRSATLGLNFDPEKIAVRTVTFGDVFGESNAAKTANPYLNKDGKMFVSLSLESGVAPGMF